MTEPKPKKLEEVQQLAEDLVSHLSGERGASAAADHVPTMVRRRLMDTLVASLTAEAAPARHGKWWDRWRDVPVASIMAGRFDRLFKPYELPPAKFSDDDLSALASAMTGDIEVAPTPETYLEPEANPGIVAMYTYLGQFIDHDITFDPTSHLREFTPNLAVLSDLRTPRLDLACVYGRGPEDQPYLYDGTGTLLLLGNPLWGNPHDPNACDLQRGPSGRALIGDPRNDENRIVAQLHATIIRFHNQMAALLGAHATFEEIRSHVRWHYQWVVINDFLPTIINHATVQKVFPHLASGRSASEDRPQVTIGPLRREVRTRDGFLMPVEFSVAAYRFGHSMIRPIYRLNQTISRRPIFATSVDPAADLGGMRPIPDAWAIDWQFFVDIGDSAAAAIVNPDDLIPRRPQHAYKIDSSVAGALAALPPAVASNPSSLALRNLLRGRDFGLPSGQAVAAALGEPAIDVMIGRATDEDPKTPIAEISQAFADNAPLWAYVLSEAHVTSWAGAPAGPKDDVPIRLGPVGGRLVAEVFAAMLLADPTSFINSNPGFEPRSELTSDGRFGIAQLINAALGHPPGGL